MSKKSKRLPLIIAQGLEVILDGLPKQALPDPEKAQQALRKYRLRPDNHLTAAFSELLEELMHCIKADALSEQDWVKISVQLKESLES